MLSLREYIQDAVANKKAIGHFNACTIDGIYAIADAALELGQPVIVGFSEGERDYVGVRQAASIIKSIREERGQPIFSNADHTYSFDRVREAIEAGFDAVLFDGAKLSFEDNVDAARKCVAFAANCGRDVIVEGELGFIGSSSKVLDAIPEGAITNEAKMTKPEEAKKFIDETGIDMLAPAVGNIHGIVKSGEPDLNTSLLKKISESTKTPIVLHGASGNTSEDIKKAIASGVAIVHVNTELRLAYRSGLMKSLSENHDEIAAYKYLKPAKLDMEKVVKEKISLFMR